MIISGLISIAGIALAFLLHLKNRALGDKIADDLGPITRLLEAKYWVDEIYQALIVNPLRTLGEFSYRFDRWIIDMLVNMAGWIVPVDRIFPEIYHAARLFAGLWRGDAPGPRGHFASGLHALTAER